MTALDILFTTQPASGHLRPLVPIAHAAQRRGHRVTVCSAERLRDEVTGYGFDFLPAGHDWTPEVVPLLPRGYFHLPFAEAADAYAGIEDPVVDLYLGSAAVKSARAITESLAEPPDLVVRELDEYGGYLAAEAMGVPHVSVASFGGPHVAAPARVAAKLDESRRELGLDSDPEAARLYRHGHVSFLPPEFGAAELALPNVRCYQHRSSERPGERMPEWAAALDSTKPTVFAGFGTVVYDLPGAGGFVRSVIEALGGLDCQAVVAVGSGRDPARYPAPGNVQVTTFVAQPLMLSSCDLFVTHGGLNSVKEALHLGVPMVGVPIAGDHRHNLASLAEAGVAEVVSPAEATVENLAAACAKVLADPGYRSRARALQRYSHVLPSVDDLVGDLEQLAGRRNDASCPTLL